MSEFHGVWILSLFILFFLFQSVNNLSSLSPISIIHQSYIMTIIYYLSIIYPVCLSLPIYCLSTLSINCLLSVSGHHYCHASPSTGTCSMDHALKWSLDRLTQLYNCFSSIHLSQSIVVSFQSKTDHGIQAHAIASPSHSVLGGKHLHLTTRPCAIRSWWFQSQSSLSFALFQHFSFLSDHLKTSAYC